MRKRYDMKANLYIEIGTDRFHTAKLGPVTAGEAFSLLRFATPEEAYKAARNMGEIGSAREVPPLGGEQAAEMLMEAHAEYQSIHDDEEYEPFGSMKWVGLSFRAKCDEVDVYVSRIVGEPGRCQIYVDHGAIDSEARACGMAALEALAPLRRPGGKK